MGSLEEVADGVFAYSHDWADGKCAVVFGADAAVAIDGGGREEDGEQMAALLRERGFEPERLVYTHGHSDHVWGASPLARGEVYAHELTPQVMRRHARDWARRWEVTEAEAAARVPWPTVTFSDELRLHLGAGRSLRLFRTPGHSIDGVSVLVEDCQVLIAGDCAVTGIVPALGDGDGRTLEATLHLLAEMEIEVMIPGHGPVARGDPVRTWLRSGADYLLGVRRRVRELLLDGRPPQDVPDEVAYEDFVDPRLPRDRLNMPQRHRASVEKITEEEQTRLPLDERR
jgi:cyclase